jgi:hypothetical protein
VNELVALGLGVGCMLLILIVIPVDSAASSDGSPFSAVDSSTASSWYSEVTMLDASSSHSTLVALSPHSTLDKDSLGLVLNKKGLGSGLVLEKEYDTVLDL